MAPLTILLGLATGLPIPPSVPTSVATWRPLIAAASARCRIPADWIERVMRAESAGHTTLNGRPIRSRAGAMGLMQLMPATWATLQRRLSLGDDPDNPSDNIVAGACYLRMLHDRFGYPGLFAAYNAGPGRYAAHRATGRALPAETVAYLAALAIPVQAPDTAAPVERLFVVRNGTPVSADLAPPTAPAPLFALRSEER